MGSGRLLATVVVIGTLMLVSAPSAGADEAAEARIKAAIVYKFTGFATWPADSVSSDDERLVLGLVGKGAVQEALRELQGKPVHGRSLAIIDVGEPEALEQCQIVYFGTGSEAILGDWLEMLVDSPVLTVGDAEGFAVTGGMIELVRQRNRMSFAINKAAVDQSGLKLGSQLLKMAKIVKKD